MHARLRAELDALNRRADALGGTRPANVLFLDNAGRILDDGSDAMREWSGRHWQEWPAEWLTKPFPMQLIGGIDPLVLFGNRPPEKSRVATTSAAPSCDAFLP